VFDTDGSEPASRERASPTLARAGRRVRRLDFAAAAKLVFPSANSTPLRNRNFRRDSFDPAAAALGLKLTPHNLRDTAASLAIQAGASVVAVARLLGHESAATTLNHYAGLFPTDLDDVAVRLDAAARQAIAKQ